MSDVLTPEQRRLCMSSIKAKDTKPEMIVRKISHSLGYRYRLHRTDLPGKPDLVFPRLSKIIFVNGCFWHMHKCKFGLVTPKTNSDFWRKKRESTVVRDKKQQQELKNLGWQVMVIWECQTRLKKHNALLDVIQLFFSDS